MTGSELEASEPTANASGAGSSFTVFDGVGLGFAAISILWSIYGLYLPLFLLDDAVK